MRDPAYARYGYVTQSDLLDLPCAEGGATLLAVRAPEGSDIHIAGESLLVMSHMRCEGDVQDLRRLLFLAACVSFSDPAGTVY